MESHLTTIKLDRGFNAMTQKSPILLRGIFLLGAVLAMGPSADAAFVAYHDLGGTTADAPGAYVTDQGTDSTQTIDLVNYADNVDTGVDFSITGANGSNDATSTANRYPDAGTDAAAIFGTAASPIVTHGGSTNEGGNSGSGLTTFTFTGLQADLLYDVAIYGERNASQDGVEEFTIHSIDWAENASSTTTQLDSFTTRFNTRPNNTNGYVARWTNIDPGSDGTFSVDIDPEVTSLSNIAYLTAMRLQTATLVEVPEVIYRETFGNDSGSDQGLSYADWTGYYGASATLLPSSGSTSGTLVSGNGGPRVAVPINSDLDSNEPDNGVLDLGFGRLLWPAGGGVSPALVYTDEYAIDRSAYDIEAFIWSQATNGGTDNFQVALQIGGQWYLSDTAFVGPSNGSSGTFDDNGREQTLGFTGAQWRSLSFTPGSTLGSPGAIVALPGGDVTAFGLYGSYNATSWFDSFTVAATIVPEPSTLALAAFGLLGLLACGRRRRR